MKGQDLKYLQLVQELSEERGLTQRDLFLRLGMAQGLVNRYLKRLAQKGWIKLTTAPPKRMLYWLTPKGMTEKTRLTYEFVAHTYKLFREAHRNASNHLNRLAHDGIRRIVFYGAEPAAEVAAMSLVENRLTLAGIVDEDVKGTTFLDQKVLGIDELDQLNFDCILLVKHSRKDDSILRRLLETKGRVVCIFEPLSPPTGRKEPRA
jgi:DNA-binding MarR family transcriptional regulator